MMVLYFWWVNNSLLLYLYPCTLEHTVKFIRVLSTNTQNTRSMNMLFQSPHFWCLMTTHEFAIHKRYYDRNIKVCKIGIYLIILKS
jgi:hypothetical protein